MANRAEKAMRYLMQMGAQVVSRPESASPHAFHYDCGCVISTAKGVKPLACAKHAAALVRQP